MTTSDTLVSRTFRYILSFGVLISLNAATLAYASPSLCSEAPSIGLDETYRGESLSVGGPECFRLETPVAGLVMLDLAVPGTATAEPRLGIRGSRCEPSAGVEVIEQSAAHVLVLSDALHMTVCVGAQDPRHELGEYKLSTAFVELDQLGPQKTEQIEADPDPFTGCFQKTEQIEADPDPFAGCFQKTEQIEADPDPFTGCFQKTEQIEADPDPFADCFQKTEQIEADPDPFAGCFQKTEQIEADPDPLIGTDLLDTLCRTQDVDDHSDSLLCASTIELGHILPGELDNRLGNDHDVFVFELTRPRTVSIETSGEVDTLGGLYDRRGQRLAMAAEGGSGENFRLVKTLQPGVYFVRVEGAAWASGVYALALDALEPSW